MVDNVRANVAVDIENIGNGRQRFLFDIYFVNVNIYLRYQCQRNGKRGF